MMNATEILEGLKKPQKTVPSKYFYDKRGSALFEKITGLEEYYPTKKEMCVMEKYIDEITTFSGPGVNLVELGSGSSNKTRLLLDHLKSLKAYYAVDISGEFLNESVRALKADYPGLMIVPVAADYTSSIPLPPETSGRRIVYYPGSTIGNFSPEAAKIFLKNIRDLVEPDGGLLIGVDLKKDREVLETAYNDSGGVTAAFNKNVLVRMNRELDADFNPDSFEHNAIYNEKEGRVEMHLRSRMNQEVSIHKQIIAFKKGETILTEYSFKYTIDEFKELTAGIFRSERVWTDADGYFSVQYLVPV